MKTKPINLYKHEAIAAAKGELSKVFRILRPRSIAMDKILEVSVRNNFIEWGNPKDEFYTYRVCPFGIVGDRLWGRETWRTDKKLDGSKSRDFDCWPVQYLADGSISKYGSFFGKTDGKERSSGHMPRWASRFLFSIESISVMRTWEISAQEIVQNGVKCLPEEGTITWALDCRERFTKIWNEIHGKHAWDRNDWVWALTLKDVKEKTNG